MKEDLSSMISSLQIGGTEVPYVSDDTYKKLRMRRYKEVANENRRKNKHCLSHATQEQKDTFSNEKKSVLLRVAIYIHVQAAMDIA